MKNFIEVRKASFNTAKERSVTQNYEQSGLYISDLDNGEEVYSDLVLVDKGMPEVRFVCPMENIEHLGLIEKIETENAKKTLALRKALESKIEQLLVDNQSLQQQMNILKEMAEPAYHSTLEQSSGTVSESFVLELTKILTQKAQ